MMSYPPGQYPYPPTPTIEAPPPMPPAMAQAGYPAPPPGATYDPYGNLHPQHPYNFPPQNHVPEYDIAANADKIGSHDTDADVRKIKFTKKGLAALIVALVVSVYAAGFLSGYVLFEPIEDFFIRFKEAF